MFKCERYKCGKLQYKHKFIPKGIENIFKPPKLPKNLKIYVC